MRDEGGEVGRDVKNEMLHCYSFGLHFGGFLNGVKGKKVTSGWKGCKKGAFLGVKLWFTR